ncbi:MAG: type IV secretion system DNA-binding domain-containing protein [Cyanobacteria bacterium P01_H01_bin.105]
MNTHITSIIRNVKPILDTRLGRIAAGFVCGTGWFIGSTLFIPASGALQLFGAALMISFTEMVIYDAVFKAYPRSGPNNAHRQFWQSFLLKRCLPSWGLLFVLGYFGLFLTAVIAFLLANATLRTRPSEILLEGKKVAETAESSQGYFDKIRSDEDPGIPFGNAILPTKELTKNILLVGMVGSGKSVSQTLLLKTVLAGIGGTQDQHLIAYDPSNEIMAMLEAMGFDAGTLLCLHPFDKRCSPWWVSYDYQTEADAAAFAELLVPQEKGSKDDSYWRGVTLLVVQGVVTYFCRVAPKAWTLRDVLLALRNLELVDKMFADIPDLKHFSDYKGSGDTTANIASTLVTKMQRYNVIAALWHKAETVYGHKPLSLEHFLENSAILVLGRSATAREAVENVNRIVLTRLTQLILEGPKRNYPAIHFYIDELSSLGRMPILKVALTELRKHGGSFIAVIQSLTQLIEIYGKNDANTMVSQFGTKAILRLADTETSNWVIDLTGKVRLIRHTQSYTRNHQSGDSTTYNQQYEEQDVVRPGVFTEIAQFDPSHDVGMKGLYFSGNQRWWHEYPPQIVEQLPPQGDPERCRLPMPREYQTLDPWTEEDYKRLNIEHLMRPEPQIDIDGLLNS